jgi:hypothetical protein
MINIYNICKKGYEESKNIGLSKRENWTPILIYIHISRIIIGYILGIIVGICISFLF